MSNNSNTQCSPSEIYVNNLNAVSDSLGYYYLIITLPVGIIGNLASIFIYTRPALNKKTNTGFLFTWLCILNICSIFNYIFITKSSLIFNYSVSAPCGVLTYIRRTAFNITSWMEALISFDRFMAVVFPNKIKLMRNKVWSVQ